MSKRVLVTGKNGQLGQSLQIIAGDYPQLEIEFAGREELDLSQSSRITEYFDDKVFDVVINCAAYTSVDKAEVESDMADQINHQAVKQLAKIAKKKDMVLIHISTDYVYNGQGHKPYVETDAVAPINVYGTTKLKGEQALQAINPKGIIIRTSWVYSEFGSNFFKTMLKLGKERDSLNIIFDQVGTPTYAGDLARVLLDIIQYVNHEIKSSMPKDEILQAQKEDVSLCEIFQYSNEGVCSWYDFAKAIFELSNAQCLVKPIETKDYPAPARRPYYSVMNKEKIKNHFGLSIPYWKDSLKLCIKRNGRFI